MTKLAHSREELRALDQAGLERLAGQIRSRIIEVVSKNGGHLSSNLGAVELIIAMHFVFDWTSDPFIFDVSHQAYAHKLLTGREGAFDSLRQFRGLSGYAKPSEGDYFVAGHSSTSISLAVGAAKAIALKKEKRLPIVLIGDGALSAGLAYEALNELGERKYPCLIILNDNEMSISKPIGAISKYLSTAMASRAYQKFKGGVERLLGYLPEGAGYLAKRFEESLRLITPGLLFEELGLEYIGPINGHDLSEIITALTQAGALAKPCIIHAQTIKGRGYAPAEGQVAKWHGVGAFDVASGGALKRAEPDAVSGVEANSAPALSPAAEGATCAAEVARTEAARVAPAKAPTATELFSQKLLRLAEENEKIVGITAAMPQGTGLEPLIEKYPQRFWDVAIAEQHGVASMAAMAREDFRPFVAIYSTFLQRAYDQVIHDCAIMNLPVVFALDRAGIVGEDGETHQGVFDLAYLAALPNFTLAAPRDPASFAALMDYATTHPGPLALRYPRGSFILGDEFAPPKISPGRAQWLIRGEGQITLLGYGQGVGRAARAAGILGERGLGVGLIDLIFAKPLDEELLRELAKRGGVWYVISDNAKIGGLASLIATLASEQGWGVRVVSLEYPDRFIEHGKTELVEASLGLDAAGLAQRIWREAMR